jgi:hypothetical protein
MAELSLATAHHSQSRHGVSLNEAFRVWLKVALLSFGGPTEGWRAMNGRSAR